MKKKILAAVLGLTLCFGMTGCANNDNDINTENNNQYTELIPIEGESILYYYPKTHIVYIAFTESGFNVGYGYMSPYYSENGKLCTYDTNTKQIVEIED